MESEGKKMQENSNIGQDDCSEIVRWPSKALKDRTLAQALQTYVTRFTYADEVPTFRFMAEFKTAAEFAVWFDASRRIFTPTEFVEALLEVGQRRIEKLETALRSIMTGDGIDPYEDFGVQARYVAEEALKP